MLIRIHCKHCGYGFEVHARSAGTMGACANPDCKQQFVVPSVPTPVDAPASWTRLQGGNDPLGRAARALYRSFTLHESFLVRAYAIAVAVCGVAAALPFLFGRSPLYCYTDLPGDGPLGGVMTAATGFGLASTGVLLSLVPRFLDDGRAWAWWLAAAGCVWLALDETLMWHEAVTEWLVAAGVPRFFGYAEQDMYIFAVYGLMAGIVAWRLLPTILRHAGALFPLVAAAVFFFLSELADLPRWETLSQVEKGLLGPFEEITKTLGVWSLLLYAVLLIDETARRRPGLTRSSG